MQRTKEGFGSTRFLSVFSIIWISGEKDLELNALNTWWILSQRPVKVEGDQNVRLIHRKSGCQRLPNGGKPGNLGIRYETLFQQGYIIYPI